MKEIRRGDRTKAIINPKPTKNIWRRVLIAVSCLSLFVCLAALFLPAIGASHFKHSIADAMRSPKSVTHLVIFEDKPFNTFPKEIEQFPNLKWLGLTGNTTTLLPDSIAHNKKLEVLWLDDFKLDPFPEVLTQMTQLQELQLRNCKIARLPASIGNLKALRILKIPNNNLTDVPDEISQLSSLRYLNVSGNYLPPAVLERVKRLLPKTDIEFEKR